MAKGIRFGDDFVRHQAERRKKWIAKGHVSGSGKPYDLGFAQERKQSSEQASITTTKLAAASNQSKGCPAWLVDLIKSDNEIAHALSVKSFKPDSPHKRALVALAKDPSLETGLKATATTKGRSGKPEHYIQVRLFYLLERDYPDFYYHAFAVPNGGLRAKRTAAELLHEGVKDGVPDMQISVPRGKYHGMYLEVKTDTGRPSSHQLKRVSKLCEQGYYAVVCKGFDECWQAINKYVKLPVFDNITEIDN
ncbi:VRR-NUC domain-containing protein [Photobacterium leiognathi]|uniref:VRR-NUC domain-containing protein n=1 Tax=Photobacterium leiognathi TaxID=553611 RepID=UPI001EE0723B|nr:VRR-NUC domain-containing protein [Photobacterium leiognathi]MCG3884160.1 VRR-NUC domain-containing protein [Photobacterium leiognathi]